MQLFEEYTYMMKVMNDLVSINAHAKINLTLDVLNPEPNGYHRIMSVMQTIALHDTITLKIGASPGIVLECDHPNLPTDRRNLVYKAAEAFFRAIDEDPKVKITIHKQIPMQAGLGGGSSDAASVLMGLNNISGRPLEINDLMKIGAHIGSDVPYFIIGGTALVSQFGENVEGLLNIPNMDIVIVKPHFGISTGWAYKHLDEMRSELEIRPPEQPKSCIAASHIRSKEWTSIPQCLHNDLELPSMEAHPEIRDIKSAFIGSGAVASLMCGSGSAVFGIYNKGTYARNSVPALSSYGDVYITRTVPRSRLEV